MSGLAQKTYATIEGYLTQCQHDTHIRQKRPFTRQERAAGSQFLRAGPIARRGTAYHSRDEGILQLQPIIPVLGGRLVSKSCSVQCGV